MRSHRRPSVDYVLPSSLVAGDRVTFSLRDFLEDNGMASGTRLLVAGQHDDGQQNGIYEVGPVFSSMAAMDGFNVIRNRVAPPLLGANGKPIHILLTDQPDPADNGVYTVTSIT